MPNLLLLMIAGGLLYGFWNSARAAAEAAARIGRNACKSANVQWLDDSVHATSLRPCRLASGWLGFQRTYRFEYSRDGMDRHTGRITMRGTDLHTFVGPNEGQRVLQIGAIDPASKTPEQ